MKKQLICGLLFGSFAIIAWGEPVNFTIDPTHTFPSFEINHLGFSTQRGRFNSTQGKISVDLAKHTGTVEITIDTNSIDTGLDKLEEHLRKADFFNTKEFPTMTFKSSDLQFDGNKLTGTNGELTLLGVTKPVSLTINNFKCGTHPLSGKKECGVDASTIIKRSDCGMKYGIPYVGDEVKLFIQAEAFEDPEPALHK